jgi:hypothetical protein
MFPNPGLSSRYNRFLNNLDVALPRRSRKNDRGAQLLDNTLKQLKEVSPEVAVKLGVFLDRCDGFRRSQFWIDEDYQNRHSAACWFPVVLLGKGWPEAVSSLLQFSPPKELGAARRIVIEPAAAGEDAIIKVDLRGEVRGVSEAGYDRFVKLVRNRFVEVESTFDPDEERLYLTGGRALKDLKSSFGESDHPTGGGVPGWLSVLLELNAVDRVTFTYRLSNREILEISDVVRSLVVIPSCPVEWRSEPSACSDALLSIRDDLRVGNEDPIHVVLTTVEHEWFPIINEHVKGILSVCALKSDDVNDSTGVSKVVDACLLDRHIGRHLSLPTEIEFFEDPTAECSALKSAFSRTEDQSPTWKPKMGIRAQPKHLSAVIQGRLDDQEYLTAWVIHFQELAKTIASDLRIRSKASSPSGTDILGRRGSGDYLVRVSESGNDFAIFILTSIANTLGLLSSVEVEVGGNLGNFEAWYSRMCGASQEPIIRDEFDALRQIMRLIITHEDQTFRCKALAALVYAQQRHDIVPRTQAGWHADDLFLISRLLGDPEVKMHIPKEIASWAAAAAGKTDALLSRGLQNKVDFEFSEIVNCIAGVATAQFCDTTLKVAEAVD